MAFYIKTNLAINLLSLTVYSRNLDAPDQYIFDVLL